MTLKIILSGAGGKMGQAVQQAAASARAEVRAKVYRGSDYRELPTDVDAVVDFSTPEGTVDMAQWASSVGIPLVSGVTGHSASQIQCLKNYSASIPILVVPNFSLGIQILSRCLAVAAQLSQQVERQAGIIEVHHQHKQDAPSGTALRLLGLLQAYGFSTSDRPISALRLGHSLGEHQVRLQFAGEELCFTHKALSRDLFACGALKAAEWLVAQRAGWYTEDDWLG